MVNTGNQQAYASAAWGGPPQPAANSFGNAPFGNTWGGPPFWHPAGLSRPLGILAIVMGFVFWWPVGLALLVLMKWSGHMGCWGWRQRRDYANAGWQQTPFQGWSPWKAWNPQPDAGQAQAGPTSGNHAFDEYRGATLRRLEEEQREFGSFLERLRFATDKAEFDQFMAERRDHPVPPPAPESQPHA